MLDVKEWRKAKGISIAKMAEMIGVSTVTWMKWEDEPQKIPLGVAYKFCDIVDAKPSMVNFHLETTRNVGLEV